jgi:nicotinate-nucleotide pyrophosphorylase (carboxylating)
MTSFKEQLHSLIISALAEDIGDGDHTTLSCIPADARGKAILKVKQEGILAGIEVAKEIFQFVEADTRFTPFMNDGDKMQAGEIAFEVEALVHTILKCERLVLNSMQRMSGIATLTRAYAESVKDYKTKILDTRKTTPNFRLLEKEAVRIGGGMNHRMGLYDMIMLKDNHIDYSGGLEKAIGNAWDYVRRERPGLKIEVETRSLDEVKRVVEMGKVDRIMLDNFSPEEVAKAVQLVHGRYETEASGGITLDNIRSYAAAGVDFISAGALIHQARSLDLSLKAVTS